VILYPAVDILGGCAVRLRKGDFAASKLYDQDPLAAARSWVQAGATHLHVVDLDGARAGHPVNLQHVQRITSELRVPVQLGGGLRSREAVRAALAAGAERVILGTAAFADADLLHQALGEHGSRRVMVSVDARGGQVVTEGWTKHTEIGVTRVLASVTEQGVRELLYTNVDRDGMLEGVGLDEVAAAAEAARGGHLIYSGGVGSLEDLRSLASLEAPSLVGVVVGKALYEGRFTVAEGQAALA
jgi:phosphoribosylformimino-5-aminoimidazole carboxamide ribotide isomerase